MIEIKDLHKSYKMGNNTLHVLKGLNFSIKEGELVAIMGSSGSGKSTLLNILGMLDEADTGDYTLDGVPIKNPNETKESRTWLVNPDYPINEEAEMIHGYSNDDLANKPTFKQIAKDVDRFLSNCDLAGYNSLFT